MDAQGWWAVAAIAASGLLTAAGWFATRRHSDRDDVLQDLEILSKLEPGLVRDRLADSVDTRLQYLADRAERVPDIGYRDMAVVALWFGSTVMAFGLVFAHSRTIAVGLTFALTAPLFWAAGRVRSRPDETKRLQARRVEISAPLGWLHRLYVRRSAKRAEMTEDAAPAPAAEGAAPS